MKKSRNLKIGKRVMSSVIAMTMAMEFAPGMALAVNAAVNENLVTSLAELYDGDTERARQELEALYEAGIIDENGNMVELDILSFGIPIPVSAMINLLSSIVMSIMPGIGFCAERVEDPVQLAVMRYSFT